MLCSMVVTQASHPVHCSSMHRFCKILLGSAMARPVSLASGVSVCPKPSRMTLLALSGVWGRSQADSVDDSSFTGSTVWRGDDGGTKAQGVPHEAGACFASPLPQFPYSHTPPMHTGVLQQAQLCHKYPEGCTSMWPDCLAALTCSSLTQYSSCMYHEHTMLSDTQNKQNIFSAIEAPGLMSALCHAEEAAGRCLHSRCNGRLSAPGRGNLRGVL